MIQFMGRVTCSALFGWCVAEAYLPNFTLVALLVVIYILADYMSYTGGS